MGYHHHHDRLRADGGCAGCPVRFYPGRSRGVVAYDPRTTALIEKSALVEALLRP